MKNENNFYDIIQSKFEEREIPFDEENWASMREMIDESRNSKKRVLWLVASLCVLLGAGGAFSIYYTGHTANNKSNPAYAMTSLHNSQNATAPDNTQPAKTISSENGAGRPSEAVQPGAVNKHSGYADVKNARNGENQVQSNETPIKQIVSNNSLYKRNIKNTRHIAKSGNYGITSPHGFNSSLAKASSVGKLNNNNKRNADIAGTSKQNSPLSGKTATVSTSSSSSASHPVPTTGAVRSITTVAQVKVHKADTATATAVLPQRFSDEPRVFQGKTNLFSIDADIEYSGGWEIGTLSQGKGFNIGAGIGYSHYLGSRLFIKTGLQFSTFGNMSPITYNYQHSIGHVIYDSVITTKRLYFIKLPVQVEFFVGRNKKSSIGLGGSIWYLVGNTGFATTYQQTDNNSPVDMQTYSQNAPLPGYNRIDVSAHGLYRYVFSRKLSMYVIVYFEITNMKDNSFFGENIVQRAHGAQCMLSYNL